MNKRKRLARTCFDPFRDTAPCQNKSTADLRQFPKQELEKIPTADETCVLCSVCRKSVANFNPSIEDDILTQSSVENLSLSQQTDHPTSGSSATVSNFSNSLEVYDDHSLETFFNISPVQKSRITTASYLTEKLEEINSCVKRKCFSQFGVLPETKSDRLIRDHDSMLANLKRAYSAEENKSVRLRLLSVLPDNWSVSKIQSEFNCSRLTALSAKKNCDNSRDDELQQSTSKKPGHQPLSSEIEKLVIDFYEDEINSRQLSGMRDVKSVKRDDGTREKVQKRLILSNIRELYASFKIEYPTVRLEFAKFARLRPQHCVIAGSSGTHMVCVCTIHQNVKLMLEGCNFSSMIKNNDYIKESCPIYDNLLKKLVCNDPNESCYDGTCEKCPNTDELIEFFRKVFDDRDIDEVKYKQWTATDRCTIMDVTCEVEEFIHSLVRQLQRLLRACPSPTFTGFKKK